MNIIVKYFGIIQEKVGKAEECIEASVDSSLSSFKLQLQENYPALGNLNYKIALNNKLCSLDTAIPEHAEIALLPPFAGG